MADVDIGVFEGVQFKRDLDFRNPFQILEQPAEFALGLKGDEERGLELGLLVVELHLRHMALDYRVEVQFDRVLDDLIPGCASCGWFFL
jgi:hypothetical protein